MNDDTQLIRTVGERRARREAERQYLAETGQLPVIEVEEWRPVLSGQRPLVPGGRRALRLAEKVASVPEPGHAIPLPRNAQTQVAPAVPDPRSSLDSLTQVALGVAALPEQAPGGQPLTWDEVFATGVGLAPALEEPGMPSRHAAASPTLLVGPGMVATWSASDAPDSPFEAQAPSSGRRRRISPRKVLAFAAVVVVLAGSAFGVKTAMDDGDGGPAQAAAPHQTTVLVGLVTGAGDHLTADGARTKATLQSAALLAADQASGDAVSLLAPSSLLLDVPGAGRETLGNAVRTGDDAPANAISDALQVRVDGSWLLTPSELASLVDAVGGVDVDVRSEIAGGGYTFAPGRQHFDGAAAAAYATARGASEPEQGRLARFEEVLGATFAAMPPSKAEIQATLVFARLSTGTLKPAELAARLVALQKPAAGTGIASTLLPFEPLTVGSTTVTSLDQVELEKVVSRWLSGAKLPQSAEGPVRVLVQNGVGVPGLGEAARKRLLDHGLRFVAGGNAQSFDYAKTKVVVPSDSAADRVRAQRAVEALGVPEALIVVDPLGSSLAEVVAVLGDDFVRSVTDVGVQPTP